MNLFSTTLINKTLGMVSASLQTDFGGLTIWISPKTQYQISLQLLCVVSIFPMEAVMLLENDISYIIMHVR